MEILSSLFSPSFSSKKINSKIESKKELNVKKDNQNNGEQRPRYQRNRTIWHNIAEEFDVNNISNEELKILSDRLYQADQININDHNLLSIDENKLAIKDIYITRANLEGRRNMVKEYEKQVNFAENHNNETFLVQKKRILDYFRRLEAAKSGPKDLLI